MIHSMGGGVIREYDNLIYVFVEVEDVRGNFKRWYISPFIWVAVGDRVEVPSGVTLCTGKVLRVENVTAQTAPFPVKHTEEIVRVLP